MWNTSAPINTYAPTPTQQQPEDSPSGPRGDQETLEVPRECSNVWLLLLVNLLVVAELTYVLATAPLAPEAPSQQETILSTSQPAFQPVQSPRLPLIEESDPNNAQRQINSHKAAKIAIQTLMSAAAAPQPPSLKPISQLPEPVQNSKVILDTISHSKPISGTTTSSYRLRSTVPRQRKVFVSTQSINLQQEQNLEPSSFDFRDPVGQDTLNEVSAKAEGLPRFSNGISKVVWLFYDPFHPPSDATQALISHNQNHFIDQSGCLRRLISHKNYHKYVTADTAARIGKALELLNLTLTGQQQKGIDNVYRWTKTIIMLHVLWDRGGILLLDQQLALTESLSWLQDAHNIPFINSPDLTSPAEAIGFMQANTSFASFFRVSSSHPSNSPFKMINSMPFVAPSLLAARRQNRFIEKVCLQLIDSLTQDDYFKDEMVPSSIKYEEEAEAPKIMDEMYFGLVSWKVLSTHINNLRDSEYSTSFQKSFQEFKLALIDSGFGPSKIQQQMKGTALQTTRFLTDLPQFEVEEMFGAFRCALHLPQGNSQLRQFIEGLPFDRKNAVRNSIIQHYFLFDPRDEQYIYDSGQKTVADSSSPIWSALPRKIWVPLLSEADKDSPMAQITTHNIKEKARQSGFEVVEVSPSNISRFIDQDTLGRIDDALRGARMHTYPSSKPQLLAMALVGRHGGVYLGPTTVLISGLEWLPSVTRLPSHYFYNRYEAAPKVVMAFSQFEGNPGDFWTDGGSNTKKTYSLPLGSSMFAAQPNSELMQEWFEAVLSNYGRRFKEIEASFNSEGISSDRMVIDHINQDRIEQDTLTLLLHRREKQLNADPNKNWENAVRYYGVWGLNGMLGPSKIVDSAQFSDSEKTLTRWLFERPKDELESAVGEVRFFYKVKPQQVHELDRYLLENWSKKEEKFHPDSLAMQTIIKDVESVAKGRNEVEVKWKSK